MSFSKSTVVVTVVSLCTACSSSEKVEKLYLTLAAFGSASVAVIDPVTDTKVGQVTVGGEPHDAICTPDGMKVYVSNPTTNNVSVIDSSTDTVVSTIDMGPASTPWHVEVSPDGKMVFVALQGTKEIAVIDTATNTVIKRVLTTNSGNTRSPWALSAPTNNKVYATLNGIIAASSANSGNEVAYFDPTAATPTVDYISVGDGPHGLVASPDKASIYVAAQKSHGVWKINVADNSVTKLADINVASPPVLSPGFPTDASTTPDGNMIITGNHDIDSISFITSAGAVSTVSTGIGSQPWGTTVSPDGEKVYVSTSGLDTLSVFDVATKTELTKISVGMGPDGFAWCKR